MCGEKFIPPEAVGAEEFDNEKEKELGIYDRAKAKEKGKEVEKPATEDCQTCERLEYVIAKEKGEDPSSPKSKGRKNVLDFHGKLNFVQPGAEKKYPGEYFLPSVSLEEAKKKIEFIKSAVEKYALPWFAVSES